MKNIFGETEEYIQNLLSNTPELSSCTFLAENRKDIDFEIKKALGRQGIVGVVFTPKATFAGAFQDVSLSWECELEIDIVENPIVNRGQRDKASIATGQDIAAMVADTLCPLTGAREGQFSPIDFEQGEDEGLVVNKMRFKCLVHKVKEQPWTPTSQCTVFLDGEVVDMPSDALPSPEALDAWLMEIGQDRTSIVKVGAFSEIGSQTFSGCSNLTDIFISQNVHTIGSNAFENCGNAKTAYFKDRSIEDVRAMQNYPWGLSESVMLAD